MRFLEGVAGFLIGLVTFLLLLICGLFSFGSMGKYIRNKTM